MNNDDKLTSLDRMRFIKNSFSANFCYLAILLNVLYFVSIYQSDVGTYFYNILVGGSIVYNLIFMLAVFLASEGVKSYDVRYSYLLLVVGLMQFVRIFIIPMRAHGATALIGGETVAVMGDGQFYYLIVCLIISAVCLLLSAAVNWKRSTTLAAYMKTIGNNPA